MSTKLKARENNIFPNAGLILLVSIILLWLPLAGAFFAGIFGARRAFNYLDALYAALLSSVAIGILMFFLAPVLTALPVQGAIARAGGFYLSLSFFLPLVLGTLVGYSDGR